MARHAIAVWIALNVASKQGGAECKELMDTKWMEERWIGSLRAFDARHLAGDILVGFYCMGNRGNFAKATVTMNVRL